MTLMNMMIKIYPGVSIGVNQEISVKLVLHQNETEDGLKTFVGLIEKINHYIKKPGFKSIRFTDKEKELIEALVNLKNIYEDTGKSEHNQGTKQEIQYLGDRGLIDID